MFYMNLKHFFTGIKTIITGSHNPKITHSHTGLCKIDKHTYIFMNIKQLLYASLNFFC